MKLNDLLNEQGDDESTARGIDDAIDDTRMEWDEVDNEIIEWATGDKHPYQAELDETRAYFHEAETQWIHATDEMEDPDEAMEEMHEALDSMMAALEDLRKIHRRLKRKYM